MSDSLILLIMIAVVVFGIPFLLWLSDHLLGDPFLPEDEIDAIESNSSNKTRRNR